MNELYFDTIHCDARTKHGLPCKMVPVYVSRLTGQRLCYAHAQSEYLRYQAAEARDAAEDPEIVHAR